ncbi:hypothetical protein ACHWQZ_G019372 [Mnemiopsis leidyi]
MLSYVAGWFGWVGECFLCQRPSNKGLNNINTISPVCLDSNKIGSETVIVKSGRRICGAGGALADTPLNQDKTYFEIKVQASGIWGVGVASRDVCLDKPPLGSCTNSWLLRHDGTCWHANEPMSTLSIVPSEGDIIGVTFDHVQLQFYVNGKLADGCVASNLHTLVYPCFYVDDGAIIDVNFEKFYYEPPQGYSCIMKEQDML